MPLQSQQTIKSIQRKPFCLSMGDRYGENIMARDLTAKNTKSHDKSYHRPSTVEEITKQNVETIARLKQATNAERANSDRLADVIANFCGSIPFVWAHVIWFTGWIIINIAPDISHFDPFPFNFLTLIVSLEAIFLST